MAQCCQVVYSRSQALRHPGPDADVDEGGEPPPPGPEGDAEQPPAGDPLVPMWERARDEDCRTCAAWDPRQPGLRPSASPALGRHSPHPTDAALLRPVANREARAGASLAAFAGDSSRCMWPLTGARWWPPPRVGAAAEANASWVPWRCLDCGRHAIALIAARRIPLGEEIVVGSQSHVLGGPSHDADLLASFDGGARTLRGRRVAGAGAILWGPPGPDGARPPLGRAVAALPSTAHAQEAEAWGCRLALEMLEAVQPRLRQACIVGDNLAVVRYGAGHCRLRRVHMQALLEPGLARIARAGWAFDWFAVRRRLNGDADDAATEGVYQAAALADQGVQSPRTTTHWAPAAAAFFPGPARGT